MSDTTNAGGSSQYPFSPLNRQPQEWEIVFETKDGRKKKKKLDYSEGFICTNWAFCLLSGAFYLRSINWDLNNIAN